MFPLILVLGLLLVAVVVVALNKSRPLMAIGAGVALVALVALWYVMVSGTS